MNRLRHLFFSRFLKLWVYYIALFFISYYLLLDIKAFPEVINRVVSGLGEAYLLLSGVFLYYLSQSFSSNITWLINSVYNRKSLIKYYFFEQIAKLFLILSPYLFLIVASLIKKPTLIGNKLSFSWLFELVQMFLPITIIGTFFFLFTIPIINRNDEMKKKMRSLSLPGSKFKFKSKLSAFLVSLAFIFFSISSFSVPLILIEFFIFIILFISSISIFDMKFMLFNRKRKQSLFIVSLALSIVLYFSIGFSIYSKILDPRISTSLRIDSIGYLGDLGPHLTKAQAMNIFNASPLFEDKAKLIEKLSYDQMDIDLVLNTFVSNNEKDLKHVKREVLLLVRSLAANDARISNEIFFKLVNQMNLIIKKDRYNNAVISELHHLISRLDRIPLDRVEAFFSRKTIFTDYVAAELLFHHTDKKNWEVTLLKFKDSVNANIVINSFGGKENVPAKYLEYVDQ